MQYDLNSLINRRSEYKWRLDKPELLASCNGANGIVVAMRLDSVSHWWLAIRKQRKTKTDSRSKVSVRAQIMDHLFGAL